MRKDAATPLQISANYIVGDNPREIWELYETL